MLNEAEDRLRTTVAAMEGGEPAIPFARAVLRQIVRAGGSPGPAAAAIAGIVREARGEGAAAALALDHPLLSAFFQNIDLLYDHGYAEADAVSAMVLHALHLAVEAHPEGAATEPGA